MGLAVVAAMVAGWNLASVTLPVARALDQDPANSTVHVVAYHRALVLPGTLVVDVWGAQRTATPLDVLRVLLQAAAALNEHSYDTVVLAYRGAPRFILPGFYFRQLGHDYGQGQNIAALIRTLPQNVRTLDGGAAFETWTGGMLGVLDRQMDDVKTLSRRWWMDPHSS
ncbi:hypothetical protein UCD39_03530 [Nitrospirillum sp. BR 11752]|uniref:hypothetical protein n=1 Tax=Nitrospirillum sp. BR 11752 TaxID=3104293 RepID=UPI002EC0ADDD|nr:hypothetical protein [Nitrospirillum sp. BR 11752]